jgi:hypothetical protein
VGATAALALLAAQQYQCSSNSDQCERSRATSTGRAAGVNGGDRFIQVDGPTACQPSEIMSVR